MSHQSARRATLRVRGATGPDPQAQQRADDLAVEAPLTIQVHEVTVATTMRTPGHDLDLALGWLVAEGSVREPSDVLRAIACDPHSVAVQLRDPDRAPAARLGLTSSACGICGSDSVAEVVARRPALRTPAPSTRNSHSTKLSWAVLAALPQRLRQAQPVFERTGGLHAAGLFTAAGDLLCAREDVGRHNAVDKVIGWALQADLLPATDLLLQVSGRASFELTQKAVMAGLPVLSAVSAPSTLAVDLAQEADLTLLGFSRGDTLNVYAGGDRLELPGGRVER